MLSDIASFFARLFSGSGGSSAVSSPSPAPMPMTSTSTTTTAAPAAPAMLATPMPAASNRPTSVQGMPAWLLQCLPLTQYFENCELVAYCDPGSPLGHALQAANLWYSYLRDRSVATASRFDGLSGAPWTCGWGSTGSDVTRDTIWTQAAADARLIQRLLLAGQAVDRLVTITITAAQKAALSDFTFNEGEGHLAQSTLLRKLNAGEVVAASQEFLKWDEAGGRVMSGLELRRKANEELFTTGVWHP